MGSRGVGVAEGEAGEVFEIWLKCERGCGLMALLISRRLSAEESILFILLILSVKSLRLDVMKSPLGARLTTHS